MSCVELVIAVWFTLAPWYQDRTDTETARRDLYRPVASAICKEASNNHEVLAAMTQAYSETKLARAVLEWRCKDMPKGSQCDHGRAMGPFQNWKRGCPAVWDEKLSTEERYQAGARCFFRDFREGTRRCRSEEGGFYAQLGAIGCKAHWAARRVRMMSRMEMTFYSLRKKRTDEIARSDDPTTE